MAIDKSRTSPWMKAVLIILIIAFVTSFITISGAGLFSNSGGNQTATSANTALDQANQRGAATVGAINAQLQSDPESYTVLVSLGNSYFDWAIAVQKASQTSTSAAGTDLPIWIAAKDAYKRALTVKPGESPVTVDYAIATYYSGDVDEAIKAASKVTKDDPQFAPAWFNLGIFQADKGDNAAAIVSFERYLKLDPEGKSGDVEFVKTRLTELKAASTQTSPTP